MSSEELNFDDVTLTEIPVKIGGDQYILREATGEAAVNYRNAMLACTQLGSSGKPQSIRGLASVEPLLVSHCLFYASGPREGQNVSQKTILSWKSKIVKALYEKVREISDLNDKDDEEKQGNEQES